MKIWAISIAISVSVCALALYGLTWLVVQDACLDSGGSWQGFSEGCVGGDTYSYFVISPVFIAIALLIVAILSWLIATVIKGLRAIT